MQDMAEGLRGAQGSGGSVGDAPLPNVWRQATAKGLHTAQGGGGFIGNMQRVVEAGSGGGKVTQCAGQQRVRRPCVGRWQRGYVAHKAAKG